MQTLAASGVAHMFQVWEAAGSGLLCCLLWLLFLLLFFLFLLLLCWLLLLQIIQHLHTCTADPFTSTTSAWAR